jgi:hypothetical protein
MILGASRKSLMILGASRKSGATRLLHAVLGLPASLEHFGVYHAYIDARQLTDAA